MSASPAHVTHSARAAKSRPNRPFFRLKSDWADWEASRIEESIKQMEAERIPSYQWAKVKQKTSVLSSMRERAASWRSKARKFRAEGN